MKLIHASLLVVALLSVGIGAHVKWPNGLCDIQRDLEEDSGFSTTYSSYRFTACPTHHEHSHTAIHAVVQERARFITNSAVISPHDLQNKLTQSSCGPNRSMELEYENVRVWQWNTDGSLKRVYERLGWRFFLRFALQIDGVPMCHNAEVFVNNRGHAFVTAHRYTQCDSTSPLVPLSLVESVAHTHLSDHDELHPQISTHHIEANSEMRDNIVIMSYNLWNLEPPYHERMKAIINQIRSYSPDIIGLQEIRYSNWEFPSKDSKLSGFGAQISDLTRELQQYGHFYWAPAMTYLSRLQTRNAFEERGYAIRHTDEGVAILSRYPIRDVNIIPLTRDYDDYGDEHQRVLLEAVVETPQFGVVSVMCTHLTLSESARTRIAPEIAQAIESARNRGHPVIIMGDFNAETNNALLQFMQGEISMYGMRVNNLTDVIIGRKEIISQDDLWTFTTLKEAPKKRIDFIFVDNNPQWQIQRAGAIESPPLEIKTGDGKTKPMFPSDHRAVMAVLFKPERSS